MAQDPKLSCSYSLKAGTGRTLNSASSVQEGGWVPNCTGSVLIVTTTHFTSKETERLGKLLKLSWSDLHLASHYGVFSQYKPLLRTATKLHINVTI